MKICLLVVHSISHQENQNIFGLLLSTFWLNRGKKWTAGVTAHTSFTQTPCLLWPHTLHSIKPTEDIVRDGGKEWWSLRYPPWRCGVVMSAAPQEDWHYCCSPPVRWPQSHGKGPRWSEVCQWCGRNDCPSPRCQWSKPVAHRPPLRPDPLLPTNPLDWISSRHKTGLLVPVASRSTDHLREAGKRFLST